MSEQASTGQPGAPRSPVAPTGLESRQGVVTIEDVYNYVKQSGRRVKHDLGLMLEGSWKEVVKNLTFERVATASRCRSGVWRQLGVGVVKAGDEVVGVYANEYVRDEETSDTEDATYAIFRVPMEVKKEHKVWSRAEYGGYETVERYPAQPREFEEACCLLEALEIRERR